jgi:hypothetical protein
MPLPSALEIISECRTRRRPIARGDERRYTLTSIGKLIRTPAGSMRRKPDIVRPFVALNAGGVVLLNAGLGHHNSRLL